MNDTIRGWLIGVPLFVLLVVAAFYVFDPSWARLVVPVVITFFAMVLLPEIPFLGKIMAPEYAKARANHDNNPNSTTGVGLYKKD